MVQVYVLIPHSLFLHIKLLEGLKEEQTLTEAAYEQAVASEPSPKRICKDAGQWLPKW